jgi:FkbM family methyltransferase
MNFIPINNFTAMESVYGKFIVNRHCTYQSEHLIKTGYPHIQNELTTILSIVDTLPEHCVVVDAGANIGLVSIPIAQLIAPRGGVVHAFEPQRMLYYALCGAAALNDLENLFTHNSAVGSKPGPIKVPRVDYAKPQDFGSVSLLNKDGTAGAEEVELVVLDKFNLPRLDFLKIDVEGMEISVLKGASRTIRKYRPWCWVEFWKVDLDKIKEQFKGLDYTFYRMDALNMLCAPASRESTSTVKIRGPSL